jgi:ABC-2 type transport system ATP-binding protein
MVEDAPEWAVAALGLRKVYGDLVAVSDLSLQVAPGEAFGFLGPNGAGKTTTLKMLLGLAAPTAGTARLLGRRPSDPEARLRVGFLPEHFRFQPWLPAGELLAFHGALAGLDRRESSKRANDLLHRVGLGDRARTQVGKMSKGMQQRLGLAQALMSDPLVVFLDEPTSGLDPLGRRLVRELIRDLTSRGVAVFLNSHLLGEVEAVCDRVAIVSKGRVAHMGPPGRLPGTGVDVEIAGQGITPEMGALFDGRFRAPEFFRGGVRLRLVDGEGAERAVADAVASLVRAGASIHRVTPLQATLEEVFLAVIGTESESGA